jgi:hypothetical protein
VLKWDKQVLRKPSFNSPLIMSFKPILLSRGMGYCFLLTVSPEAFRLMWIGGIFNLPWFPSLVQTSGRVWFSAWSVIKFNETLTLFNNPYPYIQFRHQISPLEVVLILRYKKKMYPDLSTPESDMCFVKKGTLNSSTFTLEIKSWPEERSKPSSRCCRKIWLSQSQPGNDFCLSGSHF